MTRASHRTTANASFRNAETSTIDLRGLRIGAPQTLGAVRLVPLVRERFVTLGSRAAGATAVANDAVRDLRISARAYGEAIAAVSVGRSGPDEPGLRYASFIPHGFVVSYTADGSPVAAQGAQLEPDGKARHGVRLLHRMVKREAGEGATSRFRMLPLHLAMEGFLALQFNAPDILWSEYSQQAASHGLDPRTERAVHGTWLPGLEEAVRTFEIVDAQVGVLVYVADALACAFVVPHPDDYRALHRSLLEDFFGALMAHYAILYPHSPPVHAPLDGRGAETLDELAARVARVRDEWATYGALLASGLVGRTVKVERVRRMAPFSLERFVPIFDPEVECHIGERIVRDDGTLEYLKTFRLSAAQIRRAYLLQQLAAADWHLERAAELLRTTPRDLAQRLVSAGFGYLIKPDVLAALLRAKTPPPG